MEGGGQGGCDPRLKFLGKFTKKKKKNWGEGGSGRGGWVGLGGGGRVGLGGGGVRVDVNEELKFL